MAKGERIKTRYRILPLLAHAIDNLSRCLIGHGSHTELLSRGNVLGFLEEALHRVREDEELRYDGWQLFARDRGELTEGAFKGRVCLPELPVQVFGERGWNRRGGRLTAALASDLLFLLVKLATEAAAACFLPTALLGEVLRGVRVGLDPRVEDYTRLQSLP